MRTLICILIAPPAGKKNASNLDSSVPATMTCNTFLILILTVLLNACTTVPVENRNTSSAGGFWEQDENTDPRFHHRAIGADEKIGILYASGNKVLVNGAPAEDTLNIKNNTFVGTGPNSSARIEFKEGGGICSIQIQDFSVGNGYGDTAHCEHGIITTHASAKTRGTIYHISVSGQQTEVTVLRGLVKLSLLANPLQNAIVNSGEEIILTTDTIIGPRPVSLGEIERRIRWRDNYQFYKGEASVGTALVGAGVAAAIIHMLLRDKSDGGGTPPPTRGTTPPPTQSTPPPPTRSTAPPPMQSTPLPATRGTGTGTGTGSGNSPPIR